MTEEEQEALLGKTGNRSKKNKKHKQDVRSGTGDHPSLGPNVVEYGVNLSNDGKKKKDKKRNKVWEDVELNSFLQEDADIAGCRELISGHQIDNHGEKRRKKRKVEAIKDGRDEITLQDNGPKDSEYGKKKKYKKKNEVCEDVELNSVLQEAVDIAGCGELIDGHHEEKRQKKRKIEAINDVIMLTKGVLMGGGDEITLQRNGNKDSEYDTKNGTGTKEEEEKKKKKKKKNKHKKNKYGFTSSPREILEDKNVEEDETVKERKSSLKGFDAEVRNSKKWTEKKNKKPRRESDDYVREAEEKVTHKKEPGQGTQNQNTDIFKVEKKKRKKEKKMTKDDLATGFRKLTSQEPGILIEDEHHGDCEVNSHSSPDEMHDRSMKNMEKGKKQTTKALANGSKDSKHKGKKCKKVTFSGHVEVFQSSDYSNKEKKRNLEEGLVQGKRFSREEDELVKAAVFNYIKERDLGEDGLDMVLHCKNHPEIKNCWREIGAALPHRPYTAIYYRAHTLFERDDKRSWTREELDLVKKFHEQNGAQWRKLADMTGKHRIHIKDAWRRIKLPNKKKGQWSQEEYQTLFDLVNTDLRLKVFAEKKSKYGMLRDNIGWTAISDTLSTRSDANCCVKWYQQLTSSMVAEGIWADSDDYRLLGALYNLDACCIEDVEWDDLLDHRSGDLCRKRWHQMVQHLGGHGTKSFMEQVEVLSQRYCIDVLEAREAWDSKPVVP